MQLNLFTRPRSGRDSLDHWQRLVHTGSWEVGEGSAVLFEVTCLVLCRLFLSALLLPFTEQENSPLPAAPDFPRWFANPKFFPHEFMKGFLTMVAPCCGPGEGEWMRHCGYSSSLWESGYH